MPPGETDGGVENRGSQCARITIVQFPMAQFVKRLSPGEQRGDADHDEQAGGFGETDGGAENRGSQGAR